MDISQNQLKALDEIRNCYAIFISARRRRYINVGYGNMWSCLTPIDTLREWDSLVSSSDAGVEFGVFAPLLSRSVYESQAVISPFVFDFPRIRQHEIRISSAYFYVGRGGLPAVVRDAIARRFAEQQAIDLYRRFLSAYELESRLNESRFVAACDALMSLLAEEDGIDSMSFERILFQPLLQQRFMCREQGGSTRTEREQIQRRKAVEKEIARKKATVSNESRKRREVDIRRKRSTKFSTVVNEQSGDFWSFKKKEAEPKLKQEDEPAKKAGLMRAIRDAGKAMDSTMSVLQYATETCSTVQNLIEQIQDGMRSVLEVVKKYGPPALGVCIGLVILYWIKTSDTVSDFIWKMLEAGFATMFSAGIWSVVKQLFDNVGSVKEESGMSSSVLSRIVSLGFVTHAFGVDKRYMADTLMKRISMVDRCSNGLETMVEWAIDLFQKLLTASNDFFDVGVFKRFLKHESEIDRVVKEVHELEKEMFQDPSKNVDDRVVRMNVLAGSIANLRAQFHGCRDIARQLDALMLVLSRLKAPLRAAAGNSAGYRQQPVSLAIYGDPGVGKTLMVQNLCVSVLKLAELLPANLTAQQASNQVYCKAWNSEYLDGYTGQPVYLVDDWMMKRATAQDTSNGFLDLMTYYGSYKAMLNYAALEMKGVFEFSSKMLVMTTNLKNVMTGTQGTMECPEAIIRRIDFPIHVRVKKEFRRPGSMELDYSLFQEELRTCGGDVVSAFPWHVWEWVPMNFHVGNSNFFSSDEVPGLPMINLIIDLVEKLGKRKESHMETLQQVQKILDAPVLPLEELRALRVREEGGVFLKEPSTWSSCTLNSHGISEIQPETVGCPVHARLEHKSHVMAELGMSAEIYDELYPEDGNDCVSNPDCCFGRSGAPECCFGSPGTPGLSEEYKIRNSEFLIVRIHAALEKSLKSWREAHVAWKVLYFGTIGTAIAYGSFEFVKFICSMVRSIWDYVTGLMFPKVIREQSNRVTKPRAVMYKVLQQGPGPCLTNNVYANSFKIMVRGFCGDALVLGQVTFLYHDFFVMPNHFLRNIRERIESADIGPNSQVILRNCVNAELDVGHGLSVQEFLDFPYEFVEDRDLAFGRYTNAMNARKDIRKFLLKDADITSVGGLPVRVDTARTDVSGVLVPYNERIAFMCPSVEKGKAVMQCGPIRHRHWMRYRATTEVGDCGALLTLQHAKYYNNRVWCGIHIGGDGDWGYSTILTLELVERALDKLREKTGCPLKAELDMVETDEQSGLYTQCGVQMEDSLEFPFYAADEDPDQKMAFGSFQSLGKVNKPVSIPVNSKLKQTFIGREKVFGETNLVPVKLGWVGPGETALTRALKPYAGPPKFVDKWWLKPGIRAGMKKFSECTTNIEGRVLSYREAVVGNPALGLKGIPRGTSVGYPMCLKAEDKSYFWGDGNEFDLENPRAKKLESEVMALAKLVEDGIRPFFICRGFCKDETRKQGKDARYIAGTSIHYYILCRMYFGVVVAAQMTLHTHNGMCPGIREFCEWPWLRHWVTQHGDKCWDGDFKGFDTTQLPRFLFGLLGFINEWYDIRGAERSANTARYVLFMDLAFSRHIVGGGFQLDHIVQWSRSMPSGHPLTAFINSAYSMCCMSCAYLNWTGRVDFWEQAACATLGDDNINGASDEVVDLYNQVTVAEFLLQELGLTYTDSSKSGQLRFFTTIENVSFLKRSFHMVNGRETCPIEIPSILHSTYWVKESRYASADKVCSDLLENALGELSMHGPEVWDMWSPIVRETMRRLGVVPSNDTTNLNDYLDYMLSREDSSWSGLQIRTRFG